MPKWLVGLKIRRPIFLSARTGDKSLSAGRCKLKVRSPKIRSDKGFAAVFALMLLPVLVTATLLVFAYIGGVLVERKSMMICQAELADGQRKAGDAIEQILDLNRPISGAKKVKAFGEALMTNPYTFVAGERIRTGAVIALRMLVARRYFLINKGIYELHSAMNRAQHALREEWGQQNRQQSVGLMTVQGLITRKSLPLLAIRPADSREEYPEYELMPLFSSLQAQSLSWKTSYGLTKENHAWSRTSWSKTQNCEVTLQERSDQEDRLQVRLNTGKFSLRRWF